MKRRSNKMGFEADESLWLSPRIMIGSGYDGCVTLRMQGPYLRHVYEIVP